MLAGNVKPGSSAVIVGTGRIVSLYKLILFDSYIVYRLNITGSSCSPDSKAHIAVDSERRR